MQPYSDLVILLPGITGSILEKDGKVIWGSVKSLWDMYSQQSLDLLELKSHDNGDDDLGDGIKAVGLVPNITIVPGLWKLGGYSVASGYLQTNLSLTLGENYFEFAYDWRRDNRVSARKLQRFCREKLALWRNKSGNDQAKIVFVAHSMGGLVARYYVECLEGWKDTRTLVSLGTPYRGSLNAVEGICLGLKYSLRGYDFVDGSRAFRSFQSLYQLLPTYAVVDQGEGCLKRVDDVALPYLNPERAREAALFHDEMDVAGAAVKEPDFGGRTRYVPVIGIDQPTNQSAFLASGGSLQMLKTLDGADHSGDKTVPQRSALPKGMDPMNAFYISNTHSALPGVTGGLDHIRGLLQAGSIDDRRYRGGPSLDGIALDVSDVYDASEKVTFAARPKGGRPSLNAVIYREGDPDFQTNVTMFKSGDGHVASLQLEPGSYRVSVSGTNTQSVSDVFTVAAFADKGVKV